MNAPLFPDVFVNGERIPHALIAAEAQNHTAPKGKPGIAWRKAARAMVTRTLLLQEAMRQGLSPEPETVSPGKRETDEEALIRAVLEGVATKDTPCEQTLRAEYERNKSRFQTAPLWEVSHILIACDPDDQKQSERAEARAAELAAMVKSAPSSFAKLARDHSNCGSSKDGGALGQIRPGDTVREFELALRELDAGQINYAPIKTRFGWHVLMLNHSAPGECLPFESVRDQIANAFAQVAWARRSRDFLGRLVKNAEISGFDMHCELGRSE